MGNVFLNLFNISITASWITLAVIILRFALKKAPKWINCALWAVVALRLVMPFSLESVFSLVPSTQTIAPPHSVSQTAPDIETGINFIDAPLNEYIDTNFVASVETTAEKMSFDGVMDIVGIVWAVGVVVMLAYGLISYLHLKHKVRISLPCGENVYCCDDIASPFILGVFRPRIYLPPDISEEETDYVILHEKAHLKRKDHLTKPFGFILLSVYWFNPIIWLAYLLLCRDIELACDEKAIKDMDGKAKKGYSEALLSLSVGRSALAACPLAFGEVSIRDRIKSIVNYKKPAFWTVIVAVVLCVVFAVCFLTNPKTDKDPQNSSSLSGSEQGDVSSLISSETAQTETSSEANSSQPTSRPSSLSDSVISNPFEGSSSQMPTHELSEDEKQKAYQLIKRFKQADISLLRYYNDEITGCTGFRPEKVKDVTAIRTVTDKQEIKSLVNAMRLDTWYPREQTIMNQARWAIYIDEDFKIGLMGGRQLRIETKDESYCFEAPVDVVSVLIRDCELIENADEQTAAGLIETIKQKEVSVLRYYEKSIYNPLIFHPHDEFEGAQYFRYITDSEKIDQFIDLLRLDEWKTGNMRLTDSPLYHVYFDEETYISIEDPSDDHYWVSIHTKDASAWYIVPREVYWELKEDIRARLYPRR